MGHLYTNITVRGNKAAVELKSVLIATGATYTVSPEEILKQVGAWGWHYLPCQLSLYKTKMLVSFDSQYNSQCFSDLLHSCLRQFPQLLNESRLR